MNESLDELKSIIDNAPEGAIHYDGIYYKHSGDEVQSAPSKRFGWEFVSDDSIELKLTRSLSDIKRIIELAELLEDIQGLGFLDESSDSGVSHRGVCRRAKQLQGFNSYE